MQSSKSLRAFFFLCFISGTYGANILFYFGVSTYSHRITAWPLVEALAEKGHKVTFLQGAANKNPNPKIEELVLESSDGDVGAMDFIDLKLSLGRFMQPVLIHVLPGLGINGCNVTLHDPKVMKWINSNKVDLVVIDALMNDCALGLAHKWGAQVVVFATSSVFEWWGDDFGFPVESHWLPMLHMGYDIPLTFLRRVSSTLGHLYLRFLKWAYFYPRIEPMLREKLDMPDMPPLSELSPNTSLVLMNTHFSEEMPRSLPPMIVPVGGMHCTDKLEPLPKDLEDFINKSGPDGFILVSFGSEARIGSAKKEIRDAFFNAFRNIKPRIVWKWNGPRPDDLPPNVFTSSWIPQQSVLAHPKIKLFITHGGLLSMQESLYHKVPMISFPIFAEQDYNAERVHRTKRGIRMEITSVTQEQIENAINTILTDPTYKNNVEKASKLFKDRPQKPVDTAVWWVEYVLRHKDDAREVLRPQAYKQWWFQRRALDVWAFIAAICSFIVLINWLILKKLLSLCCGASASSKNNSKTKTKVKKQ